MKKQKGFFNTEIATVILIALSASIIVALIFSVFYKLQKSTNEDKVEKCLLLKGKPLESRGVVMCLETEKDIFIEI